MWIIKIFLITSYLVTGLIFTWLAHASRAGTLPRNYFSGYRTAATMTNDVTWREAHHAAWPWTAGTAAVGLLTAAITALAPTDTILLAGAIIGAIALLAITLTGAVIAQRAATGILHNVPAPPHT